MNEKIFSNMGKWVSEYDEKGNCTSAQYDEGFLRLLGVSSPDETDADRLLQKMIHPEDRPMMENLQKEIFSKHSRGMDYDLECRMCVGSGYNWFHIFGHCTRRADGSPERINGVLFDIQHQVDNTVILNHERLRREVLAYIAENENEDPIELLKTFAEPLRVLIDCDQVIYRDLEETRIMVNSPSIADTWSVPMDYCRQCQHFDAHHPMYAGGYTEMNNCQEGWQGIPVYEKCPIKSSLTRIVYCDGEVAGYLAIHYVQKYHEFTDTERSTLEEFTRILSLSLSRYEARKRAGEVSSIKRTLSQNFVLSDQFDPIMVVDPKTGEYDWLMSVADNVADNTAMSLHGEDFYKDIAVDTATIIHPDTREQFKHIYSRENLMKIAETGEIQETEHQWFIRTEGRYRWKYNKIVRMIDENGKVFVVVGVIDTTEAKRKEEELKAEKQQLERQQRLAENSARLFALEDTFESLYDVELESGHYVSYDRDEMYRKNISDKLVSATEFFKDLRTNVERVVYEEDREGVYNVQTREAIVRGLAEHDHIDHYYRILTETGTMWLKMRIVYKDAERKNVIVGVFNAEEEMAAKQKEESFKAELLNTNARLFALEDTFESLYDVEIESGHYEVFVKGDFFRDNVLSKLSVPKDYFEELRDNIEAVIYEEDREGLYETLTRESLRQELSESDHFDYYYRLKTDRGPVWFKMRIVYKDADRKNVIIGVFNAAEDMEAKQIAQQQKQLKEALTFTNFFLGTYLSAYYVDFDTLSCQVYKRTEEIEKEFPIITNYYDSLVQYILSDVHPEDRTMMLEVARPENMKKRLAETPEFSVMFRNISGGTEKYYRMQVIRGAEEKHAAFGFIDITAEVTESKAKLREAEEARKLIESVAASYDVAYAINMAKDTYILLKNAGNILDDGNKFENYSESKRSLFRIVHPSDRDRMVHELEYATIRQNLKEQKSYNVEFRAWVNGVTSWHEMNVTLIDEDRVALGFADKDLEITKRHLEDRRFKECFALFVVDVDTEMLKIVKNEEHYQVASLGASVPYGPYIRKLAMELEDDPRDFYLELSDMANIKRELATEDKRTYSYRSTHIEGNKWVDVTVYVIHRHEDGTPAMFTLGFSIVDTLASTRQELQSRLTEDMQMIGGLATGYDALYYLNINEGIFKQYALDEEKYPGAQQLVDGGKDIYAIIRAYGLSEHIHPEDRQQFSSFGPAFIRDKLVGTKKAAVRFRVAQEGGYRWDEMEFIKYEEADEEANAVAIGFAERDAEIRSEQAINNTFEVLGQKLSGGDAINQILSIVGDFYGAERSYVFEYRRNLGLINNTYEWCAEGIAPMIEKLQDVSLELVEGWNREFRRQGAFYMDALDSEHNSEDTVAILEMQGIERLVAAPILNGDEIVGFIGVDNPTKAGRNISILDKASSVVFSEILKRAENGEEHVTLGKLADTFLSVYYIDLSSDYMRTWKIDAAYKDAYAAVRSYSGDMGGYVENFVSQRDRDRCRRMTSTEFILAQFKDRDKFSVDFTDTMLGYERACVFDFIKVSADGKQLVLCSRDVTETLAKEKEQQQILEEARIAAEAANKSKTDFLFNMSHDIRTPMNAIIGFTNMAVKHIDNKERVLDCLGKTQKAGSMLLSLINSVLEVSRIESGHATLEEQEGDVYYSFSNIEQTMQELASTKDITLSFDFGTIRDRYVYADFSRCMRIFLNVISNAIKYTQDGGEVKVTCEEVGEAKGGFATFRYTVADNGIGMSEEFQKHVFDQFARENNSTVSGIQGSGLGMAVVKSFVDLMGGTIECRSEQGVGTTFEILLPFKVQSGDKYTDPETGETISKKKKAEKSAKVDFTGKTVLLVEDNEMNREIATEILEEEGLMVEEAEDGTVAVKKLRKQGPGYYDFVLMDVQMPKMNGYEATRQIRAMYPDAKLPIIALSANAFAEDKQKSLEAGMDDHVAKPINIKELFAVMANYL